MDMSLVRLVRAGRITLRHGARTLRQRRRLPPSDERLDTTMPDTLTRTRSATRAGKLVEGQLDAENEQLVVSKLRSMGYAPIEIEQQGKQETSARS